MAMITVEEFLNANVLDAFQLNSECADGQDLQACFRFEA